MTQNELKKEFEALLFASGDPLPTDRVCDILECKAKQVEDAAQKLIEDYEERDSALSLIKINDSWQLTTKPEFAVNIRKMLEIQRNTPLSQAAFEVLAVVAYNQPVTKSFVEQVRGVDCSGVMSSLVEKDLIEEKGRLELPGRPLIYGTTERFLRCFSLESLQNLPPLPEREGDNNQETNEGELVENAEATSETNDQKESLI